MKNIFTGLLLLISLLTACQKTKHPQYPQPDPLKFHNSELLEDWISLQLLLVKRNTGVTHIAYSRHFAYTGIALYESFAAGDSPFKSLAGKLNGQFDLPSHPAGKPLFRPVAANAAIAETLRFFYADKAPLVFSIDSLEQLYFNKYKNQVKQLNLLNQSQAYGKQVALAVTAWSKSDGADHINLLYETKGEGYWEPTPAAYAAANVPGWVNVRAFIPGSTSTMPPAPVPFSKETGTAFYTMVREVYDVSQSLTDEQKAIANFWDDAPNGKYVSVFGHWFSIFKQLLRIERPPLGKAVEAYLRLGITMHDAGIATWKAKYTFHLIRPITYIRKHMGIENWNSFIGTPPHPEYVAAHATLSGSAAYALEKSFGAQYSFTDHTYDHLSMAPRKFNSISDAAKEAGLSRLFGGIHYRRSIEQGLELGRNTAAIVDNHLKKQNYFPE